MIHIKSIMVPVDFSDTSKKAVNYGLSLALQFNTRLVLAHVMPFTITAPGEEDRLLDLIPIDCRKALDFEIVVKSGEVRHEILEIVNEKEIDLVVMGTHGRPYFERLLLGSVTERMLRKLHVPILTVSHLDPDKEIVKPAAVPFEQILYATDLAEGAEAGLELSARLARGLDARLTVAHVVQPFDAAFRGIETAAYLPDVVAEVRARAGERLAKSVARVSDGSVPITTVVAEGIPYEAINRVAAEVKADLIVINLQSKGMLERALLGSTAERVIRTATVPVLSLPLPATYASRWAAA
jgi:nucleotide-binding universal stress UspA family protein